MIAFTDGYDTWIAKSLDDLKMLMCDEEKIIDVETFEDCEWIALSDDLKRTIITGGQVKETRTIKEWIEKKGRGFLCSTEI